MLACFLLFFTLVALCLVTGHSVSWALLGGLLLFWGLGRRRGFTHRQLWDMAWAKCKKSLIVVTIILLIGIITGLWRLSGTIAGCIVWGVSLITPQLFLVSAFLLCAALSYILGTSYGVCSTMGVILMALARSGGVDAALAAGAVLSGAYFGDRCSPASSAASLVAAVTETDLYRNVRQMLRTGLLPTLLTIAIYTVLSFFHPLGQMDEAVLTALEQSFTISWPVLLPAMVMLVLPLFKVPIKLAMAASIVTAALVAVLVQGFTPLELLRSAWSGYHPADAALEATLGGGGITSMASSYVIVTLTGLYSGILESTGSLEPLERPIGKLADRVGDLPAMMAVSAGVAAVLCNQAVTTMLSQQLMGSRYVDQEELAMDIENSGILIAGLVPWSIACSIPLSMLGSDSRAIPFAFLLWLIPICYLFTKRFFYSADTRKGATQP